APSSAPPSPRSPVAAALPRRCRLNPPNSLLGVRWILGHQLRSSHHRLPVDPHRIFLAQLARHFPQRRFHRHAVFRLQKIHKRFIRELAHLHLSFRSRHHKSPRCRANDSFYFAPDSPHNTTSVRTDVVASALLCSRRVSAPATVQLTARR